jgi:L-fuconolactonase
MLRIDAHHHLWRYDEEEFGWLDDSMAALRRDFLVGDLEQALASASVHAAVAVQARQSVFETRFLLQSAKESSAICAVVGWVPLRSMALSTVLDEFVDQSKLVGVREIAQGQPVGFLDDESFNQGIRELTSRGLTYDVLIYENQLEEVTRFVQRHPQQKFVLDHAAKPKIAAGELKPWRNNIKQLGDCDNTSCKLSGLVTEAAWKDWNLDTLRPYLDTCVEAFGPKRLMAGSDWPVCLVATEYACWWSVLEEYFADFSEEERHDVFGRNAIEFYGIEGVQA